MRPNIIGGEILEILGGRKQRIRCYWSSLMIHQEFVAAYPANNADKEK
jgi:hypothetical protein